MTRYQTFTRTAASFEDFPVAEKRVIERDLSFEEALENCRQFNDNRTPAERKAGTKMEFRKNRP